VFRRATSTFFIASAPSKEVLDNAEATANHYKNSQKYTREELFYMMAGVISGLGDGYLADNRVTDSHGALRRIDQIHWTKTAMPRSAKVPAAFISAERGREVLDYTRGYNNSGLYLYDAQVFYDDGHGIWYAHRRLSRAPPSGRWTGYGPMRTVKRSAASARAAFLWAMPVTKLMDYQNVYDGTVFWYSISVRYYGANQLRAADDLKDPNSSHALSRVDQYSAGDPTISYRSYERVNGEWVLLDHNPYEAHGPPEITINGPNGERAQTDR